MDIGGWFSWGKATRAWSSLVTSVYCPREEWWSYTFNYHTCSWQKDSFYFFSFLTHRRLNKRRYIITLHSCLLRVSYSTRSWASFTLQSRVHEHRIVTLLVNKFAAFTEHNDSFPCSQNPATEPYVSDLLNPIHTIINCFFKTHFSITRPCRPTTSKWPLPYVFFPSEIIFMSHFHYYCWVPHPCPNGVSF